MHDHLASCLIGANKNQTFNVYHGSGSNGKSIIADLMSVTLGEYKGTVPITLVTDARGKIGGTSDEVLKLKGVRYAVMQEPSKGVKLNEGIMKELTGGDPIQARGLYSESEIFEPQFSLVVCTNNLFDIESNDDGTWRRIRKCDFLAKFIDEGENRSHAEAANLIELFGLALHPFGIVEDHHGRVHCSQGSVGVFGKVRVAWSIQEIDAEIAIIELHHGGRHRDSALLL